MKVAIIGAGMAGLSCAHEFERYNIKPVIFERNSFTGEAFNHVGAALEIVSRPIKNPLKHLKNNFGIEIKPTNTVNKIIHHSPHKTTVIKGNLGYFLERSKSPTDIKNQIFAELKNTTIHFNTEADYRQLIKKFDYVVAANGNYTFADELGCWIEWLNTYVRGAMIEGHFDQNTMIVWINKDYCKNGYAYLTPLNSRSASLNLVVPDAEPTVLEDYWELFLISENLRYSVIEEFTVNHRSGLVYPHRIGNLFLAGNAGGMMGPFLGFGVSNSIISGVLAARSIVKKYDYEKLLSVIIHENSKLYEFRKIFNQLNNTSYDLLVKLIGLPLIKHLTYYTNINVVKYGSFITKIILRLKNNSYIC